MSFLFLRFPELFFHQGKSFIRAERKLKYKMSLSLNPRQKQAKLKKLRQDKSKNRFWESGKRILNNSQIPLQIKYEKFG